MFILNEKTKNELLDNIIKALEQNTESLIDSYSDNGEWINIYSAFDIVTKEIDNIIKK